MESDFHSHLHLLHLQWFWDWYDETRAYWFSWDYCKQWNCQVPEGIEGVMLLRMVSSVFNLSISGILPFALLFNVYFTTGESRSWHGQQLDWPIWCWFLFFISCFGEGILLPWFIFIRAIDINELKLFWSCSLTLISVSTFLLSYPMNLQNLYVLSEYLLFCAIGCCVNKEPKIWQTICLGRSSRFWFLYH